MPPQPKEASYDCLPPLLKASTPHSTGLPRISQHCTSYKLSGHCIVHADAGWLQTAFFNRYAAELAQPGIQLTDPADIIFLTLPMLDKINWASRRTTGSAWQQAVTAALTHESIKLKTRYRALEHRFPQMLACVGVKEAGKP